MKRIAAFFAFILIIFVLHTETQAETGNITTYVNTSYSYTLNLSDRVSLDENTDNFTLTDSSVTLFDTDGLFSATLSCVELDAQTLLSLRNYLNDYTSSDDELFTLFSGYSDRQFEALIDGFRNEFLYGMMDELSSEANMKVFSQKNETYNGQVIKTTLYNTLFSDQLSSVEETHLQLVIPVNITRTIYALDFIVPKGALNEICQQRINEVVSSFHIQSLSDVAISFDLFHDQAAVASANEGIYPDLQSINISFTSLKNEALGYSIDIPSSFSPYMENHLATTFDYKSYKIDYNHTFSIIAEPAIQPDTVIKHKINEIRQVHPGQLQMAGKGVYKFNNKNFNYFKYKFTDAQGTFYNQDYFIVNNGILYSFRLESRFVQPSPYITRLFQSILRSLQFSDNLKEDEDRMASFSAYSSEDAPYTFTYPTEWKISKIPGKANQNDRLQIQNPDFSGPLDIYITESELISDLTQDQLASLLTETETQKVDLQLIQHDFPYLDAPVKILTTNLYTYSNCMYGVKQLNFRDENGRNKLCFAVDIVAGRTIYSLFVVVSDYITKNGELLDENLRQGVNKIIGTFSINS